MNTVLSVNRTIAPNEELLNEEITSLSIGTFHISYPASYPRDVVINYPGITLTSQQETDVINTIINHTETLKTSEQDRVIQDTTDLDRLVTDRENWGTMTDAQKFDTLEVAIRCICRIARNDPI